MRVQIGAPLDQGTWDGQRRRVIPIVGGTFEGPRFSGIVLPGGADWQSVRVTDGVARIDARYTLRHDDGTLVTMVDRGYGAGRPRSWRGSRPVRSSSRRWTTSARRPDSSSGRPPPVARRPRVCLPRAPPARRVELDIFRVL